MTLGRRQFAGLLGAAFFAPLAPPGTAWAGEAKLPVPAAEDEALSKALAFLDRHVAALRARSLWYDREPSFIFQVRPPSKRPAKP